MKQTKTLIEGALTVAIFAVILIMTMFIPVLSIVSMWFLPLPMIFFAAKNGLKPSFLVLVVAIVIALIISGPLAMAFAAYFLLPGLVMGFILHMKKSAFAILLGGSLTNMAMLLILYGVTVGFFHLDPINMVKETINQSMATAEKLSKVMGQEPKAEMAQIQAQLKMLPYFIPYLIVLTGVIQALVVELVSTPILRRLRVGFPTWPPFREWHFPRSLIWYYLAVLIIMLLGNIQPESWLFPVVINIYYLLETVMVVQGLSFIFFFAHAKKMSKAFPIIAVVLTVFVPYLMYIVRILGIIDLGFDMRERIKKK
ncbi:uncharacterized protein YybS (DUF2232 family) [Scopulibacillus darangshiensis]|uniref:Uncharacterized protein YybS (DUF2232 family) n=1 Tax=Scopulibacillus darangshiensis TaxID=442528 RepID=A0A4R2NFJ2_9BACL|nr:YybS family protein [Scopulibacillus darangshiensis]TCP20030.1 uncharacterized protein YybS (DUF2232 family) [Scopulibacillus darangshiensis]